jgi:hypothetical protein
MVRRASLQNTMTKGVLDPRLSERIDIAHYYSGLHTGTNAVIRPQGGAHRRPGADGNGSLPVRIRRRLDPIHLTSGMMTALNGGSTANLANQSPALRFVSSSVNASPFGLVEIDLGAAVPVCMVDVLGFRCATLRADNALAVEYYDGTNWLTFGAGPSGLSLRRSIRSIEFSTKTDCRLATTEHVPLSGLADIDGVTPAGGDRILVKNQNNAADNGIYVAGSGGWPRAFDMDTVPEFWDCGVFVTEGDTQAQSWWRQPVANQTVPWLFERVAASERNRRFAVPPGQATSTRYLRLMIYDGVGIGAVTMGHVRVWREKRAVSRAKMVRFSRDGDTRFVGVLTDNNLDLFADHTWIAALSVPIDEASLHRVTTSQSLDTLFLYEGELATRFIQRQGANNEWESSPVTFFNVPQLGTRTSFSGTQDEVQDVTFTGLAVNDQVRLYLGSWITAPITFVSAGALPASIVTALEAMPGVGSGNVTATLITSSPLRVRVQFKGAAGGRFWATMAGVVLGVSATATVSAVAVQKGTDLGGPLFGETTGWPRAGVLYQGRHCVGGMLAAGNTVIGSRTGNAYDFTSTGDPLTADLAFVDTFQSDQAETIREMFVGKHLLAFTDAGVWFTDTRAPRATEPRNWRLGSRPGIEPGVPIAWTEQAAHYIQKGGGTLRQLLIAESVEADYIADPANILNPVLVQAVTDCAVAQPLTPDEGARVMMRRANGTITCLTILRSQELLAVTPWETAAGDVFEAVLVDDLERTWVLTRRTTEANGADVYLEKLGNTLGLDGALTFAYGSAITSVTGLDMHEGRQVWAYADGDLVGPFTVASGAITLPRAASAVTVGLFTPFEIEPMPLREKLQNGYPWREPGRIFTAEIGVRDTGHLEISANGGPFRAVPLMFAGDAPADAGPFSSGGDPGLPLLERLRTGSISVPNLRGWSKHPRITLRQTKPAPVEVTALRCELAHS